MPQCSFCLKAITDAVADRCPHCGAWLSQGNSTAKPNPESLAATVRSLLAQGRKIEAVKVYREQTGFGLAEAKDAVERLERNNNVDISNVITNSWNRRVLELLMTGKKIAAIKLYRQETGVGLKAAKDAVEAMAVTHGIRSTPSGSYRAVAIVLLAMIMAALIGYLSSR